MSHSEPILHAQKCPSGLMLDRSEYHTFIYKKLAGETGFTCVKICLGYTAPKNTC